MTTVELSSGEAGELLAEPLAVPELPDVRIWRSGHGQAGRATWYARANAWEVTCRCGDRITGTDRYVLGDRLAAHKGEADVREALLTLHGAS